MSHAWSVLSLTVVRFVLKRGPFCPKCGPFCPGHGPYCLWSVLSMVRFVLVMVRIVHGPCCPWSVLSLIP